jgi:hypothetical protein
MPKPDIPVIENIHRVVYDAVSRPGALDMGQVHACETTHCRAGWVVTLAGGPGEELEKRFGWLLAGMLTYRESGYEINPSKFYEPNDVALADMQRLAESGVEG